MISQLINYLWTIKLIANHFNNWLTESFVLENCPNSPITAFQMRIFSMSMIVNWISLGCEQNKTLQEFTLGWKIQN